MTYAEWDRVFSELAHVSMPVQLGEALAKRKAHVERSRAAGWTAEQDWQNWRYLVTTAKWRIRRQQREAKAKKLMQYARTTISAAPRVSM